jgi:MbtH protein
MTNPFDSEQGTYTILTNSHGQHSLWPGDTTPPAGWTPTYGPATRADCLDHVNQRHTTQDSTG